jgi:isoaspartyl peptidase/L-asparaginase-like protein (Ntn-hydrolase superfamily)
LNSEGELEMDASLAIIGSAITSMGIVSGITGIKNPLEVCKKMIEE